MKNIIKSSNLNELGNKLIDVILNRKNVFDNFSIVFPNSKMEQWFKTYWLKNRKEILMNVNFSSLNDIILKLLQNEKHLRLMKKDDLKKYIIKHLAKQETLEILPNHIKDFFYINGELNPIKLYDLANELASLYMDYEQEAFNFNGFEKQLYNKVLEEAYEQGYSTLGYLFENRIGVKKSNQILYLFGFNSINKLQEKIINEYSKDSDINLYCLENCNDEYKDYSLTLAPSKLREIEYVHTTICELLKDNENKYSDFLVLAPNISDYESIITRVFKQDNINFPNIPFTINDKKKVNSNVSTGILKLFDIANKKFFTRLDFFELINNQDIKFIVDDESVLTIDQSGSIYPISNGITTITAIYKDASDSINVRILVYDYNNEDDYNFAVLVDDDTYLVVNDIDILVYTN